MKIYCFLLLTILASCNYKNKSPSGIKDAEVYNEKALKIFSKNSNNKDSVHLALIYIDTAISLDITNTLYLKNKIEILKSLNQITLAIKLSKDIINLEEGDFKNLYDLGILYQKVNLDSSNYFFNLSYSKLQNGKEMNIDEIYIDYYKLKILYKLEDTINYSKQILQFKNKYENHELFDQLRQAIVDTTMDQ